MAIIVLLQRDLRLHDNPALYYAAENNQPIIPIYLNEPHMGSASQWWRNKSFLEFRHQLNHHQIPLLYYDGPISKMIELLQNQISITDIYWNNLHPSQTEILKKLEFSKQFYPNFLFPPDKINRPFKLFAPYWRFCLNNTVEFVYRINLFPSRALNSVIISNLHPLFLNFKKTVIQFFPSPHYMARIGGRRWIIFGVSVKKLL